MATRNRTRSEDPYQNVVDVQAMLAFVSLAIHENARTEDETFGRYLIIEHCRDKLNAAKDALEQKPALGVVNG